MCERNLFRLNKRLYSAIKTVIESLYPIGQRKI